MTWLDEDIKKVENAIIEAVDNTKYPNTIDELFDGDTWVVHFYYIAELIRDEIEEDCENCNKDVISKALVKQYMRKSMYPYIQDFILNTYDNLLDQLSDRGYVEVKD